MLWFLSTIGRIVVWLGTRLGLTALLGAGTAAVGAGSLLFWGVAILMPIILYGLWVTLVTGAFNKIIEYLSSITLGPAVLDFSGVSAYLLDRLKAPQCLAVILSAWLSRLIMRIVFRSSH